MLLACLVSVTMLAGCSNSSAPSGIVAANSGAGPASTASIVPLKEEGAVVDLPYSGAGRETRPGAASQTAGPGTAPVAMQRGEKPTDETAIDETELSPEELHRRELINRGDLPEGAPLDAR